MSGRLTPPIVHRLHLALLPQQTDAKYFNYYNYSAFNGDGLSQLKGGEVIVLFVNVLSQEYTSKQCLIL